MRKGYVILLHTGDTWSYYTGIAYTSLAVPYINYCSNVRLSVTFEKEEHAISKIENLLTIDKKRIFKIEFTFYN